MSIDAVDAALAEASSALVALRGNNQARQAIVDAAKAIAGALEAGGRVFSCGNGGSMCDAMHFAEELSGRFRGDRRPFAAQAISDVGHMTCVANDYGYEQVFSRYLEAHGRPGDVLVAISTSGRSESVVNAAAMALCHGMTVVALTGMHSCPLATQSHLHIATPAGRFADRVQELHIKVIHILIELIEQRMGMVA